MPLTQKKRELQTVLENISDGVLFIDNRGTIKFYNRALMEIFPVSKELAGMQIFSLPMDNCLRAGIFRADKGFPGPYCWERYNCPSDKDCPGKDSQCCRCWIFHACSSPDLTKDKSCIDCPQYRSVRHFLEKPKELEIGEKTVSVLSSFIEFGNKDEIWEIILFRDVTYEKLDAVVKLASATAHELRQPLQVITACASLIQKKIPENSELGEDIDVIKESCNRMNSIITKIGHITRYKTRQYLQRMKILDIEESSSND